MGNGNLFYGNFENDKKYGWKKVVDVNKKGLTGKIH
jgi:hypothetical protein